MKVLKKVISDEVNKQEIVGAFVLDVKKRLLKKQRRNYVSWVIFSSIIMLINLAIIVASIAILTLILNHFKKTPNPPGYLQRIIGPTLLLLFGLFSLIIFLVIAVFQTKTKRFLYKSAFRDLQFEMIKYNQKIEDYSKISRTKLFRKKIALIKADVQNTKKKKITFNRLVKSVLLKDPDD